MAGGEPGDGCMVATFICIAIIFLILALFSLFSGCLILAIACFSLIGVDIVWYFVVRSYLKKNYSLK